MNVCSYHFERLLGAQQVEHGLQMVLDVAGRVRAGRRQPPVAAALRPAQHHGRALVREVALIEAAKSMTYLLSLTLRMPPSSESVCQRAPRPLRHVSKYASVTDILPQTS